MTNTIVLNTCTLYLNTHAYASRVLITAVNTLYDVHGMVYHVIVPGHRCLTIVPHGPPCTMCTSKIVATGASLFCIAAYNCMCKRIHSPQDQARDQQYNCTGMSLRETEVQRVQISYKLTLFNVHLKIITTRYPGYPGMHTGAATIVHEHHCFAYQRTLYWEAPTRYQYQYRGINTK